MKNYTAMSPFHFYGHGGIDGTISLSSVNWPRIPSRSRWLLSAYLDATMQQVVGVALTILSSAATTPEAVLDSISDYIRTKRNVALDRVAFEERRQGPSESFDDIYIGLRRLAEAADL